MSEQKPPFGEIVKLMLANDTEAFVFNRQLETYTWEPMILSEFDPPFCPGGRARIKFVPKKCSEAFPGDLTCYWTEEVLQRRIRKVVEVNIEYEKDQV